MTGHILAIKSNWAHKRILQLPNFNSRLYKYKAATDEKLSNNELNDYNFVHGCTSWITESKQNFYL